jgi:hypothetical protein
LSGVPLFSWLALAGLLSTIGAVSAVYSGSIAQAALGTAGAVVGVAIAAGSLRASARVTDEAVEVQNRIRAVRLPFENLAEVSSRAVETPMTRANGWGQIELGDSDGRRVRIVASTGLSSARLRAFLAEIKVRVPAVSVDVDEAIFPSVGSGRRE